MLVNSQTATSPANLAHINKMVDNLAPTLDNLAARWQCEKEYEDIADYGKVIQAALPEGFKLTKMSKKPFGFRFTIGTDAEYFMFASARKIGWKRVG